ncbi:MAG: EAL domain-containing protein [Acidimicrobiales bacterium]|nr:EAL domain-containing protein [Acidimicrobiales bacterium]
MFAESMSALEEETAASARLDRALLDTTLPLSTVIYRVGSPERIEDETSMLDSIVTLAQRLGLHVVAEGIEMRDDLDRLRGYGQVAGQGFLFARPMPGDDIRRFRAMLHDSDRRPIPSV